MNYLREVTSTLCLRTIIAATRQKVANTFESRSYLRGKGKKSRNEQDDNEQDERSKPKVGSLNFSVSGKEGGDPDDRPTKNAKFLRPN